MKASYDPKSRNTFDSGAGEPPQVVQTDPQSPQFQSVQEQDEFLALWTHRYDYLWAAHPDPGERPDWQTESRYPLSDRLIQQGTYLYGFRFGKLTRYLTLDIDRHSAYHPCQDPFAIIRMLAALEVIGLVAYVAVTSSYSGGLHLYFPFAQKQKSWAIALVVSTLLEQAGFKLKQGELESFPNSRPYTSGTPSLYNGHRLPLQAGSYLLNQHWEQTSGDQATFVERWRWAERRNDLQGKTIKRVLKQTQRQQYQNVTGSAHKFLNDLHTEVERGWTGSGQTNRLLGRIAMREYIFGHVLRGGNPLNGQALVDAIVEVAVALPGYEEWCRHRHEIHKRALSWARKIEAASRYYPYDPSKGVAQLAAQSQLPANNIVSFNQLKAQEAERRIRNAIASLQATDNFPAGASARADAIVAIARCSKQTLNKHKALWHPEYTGTECTKLTEPNTAVSDSPAATLPEAIEPLPEGAVHSIHPNKFMPYPAAPLGQAERQQEVGGGGGISTGQVVQASLLPTTLHSPVLLSADNCNQLALGAASATARKNRHAPPSQPQIGSTATVITPAQSEKQRQQKRREEAKVAKMQGWLESDDPILVKEAQAWFAAQSERLLLELPAEPLDLDQRVHLNRK